MYTVWWFGTFFDVSHILETIIPIDSYFSEWLKAPTSTVYIYIYVFMFFYTHIDLDVGMHILKKNIHCIDTHRYMRYRYRSICMI